MAEQAKDDKAGATPAIDVAAITKTVTETVVKTVTEKYDAALAEIKQNVGVLADTLKNAPPAKVEEKKDPKAGENKAEALTPEAVAKLVADGIAAAEKAKAEAAGKSKARDELVAKVVKEKLGGDADLGKFLAGEDEAAITASAEAIASKIKTYKPDFGGASKDGGTVPGGEESKPKLHNLSPGTAAYANSLKLPA